MIRRSSKAISRCLRGAATSQITDPISCTSVPLRSFHCNAPERATYRRFGQPIGQQSSGSISPLQRLLPQLPGGKGGNNFTRGTKSGQYYIYVIVGAGGIYYVIHLEKVPSTGRYRFIDVSPAQERALGQEAFQETMQQVRHQILPGNDPRVRHVRAVAERIVEAARRSEHPSDHLNMGFQEDGGIKTGHAETSKDNIDWEVFVIQDDKQANAFVLPNGKIFVFSGILPICKDTDGLATVLGHEVAHKVLRHPAEKMSGYKVFMFGSVLLQAFGLDYGISSLVLKLLMELPNSRKAEVEADKIGLQLMSMACFDPSKAPSLW